MLCHFLFLPKLTQYHVIANVDSRPGWYNS